MPAGADGPIAEGPFADRDTVRYVIEVMGFADAVYQRRKENTHARMKRIGRVIRMVARQLDGTWNDSRQPDRKDRKAHRKGCRIAVEVRGSDWEPPIAKDPGALSGIGVPEVADLERLRSHREASQCETPVAPPGQGWREIAAGGIEMAATLR